MPQKNLTTGNKDQQGHKDLQSLVAGLGDLFLSALSEPSPAQLKSAKAAFPEEMTPAQLHALTAGINRLALQMTRA